MLQENNALPTEDSLEAYTTLKHLLSSKKWEDFLRSLSIATGFEFSAYDENNNLFFLINENPICKVIKSSLGSTAECPDSCNVSIAESLKADEPLVYKCYSRVTNFSVPIRHLEERAVIVGKKGFASYEDFLEFLRIAKDKGLYEIPITTSLDFVDERYIRNFSSYIYDITNHLLNNLYEKNILIEKINRFTSLSGTNIIEKISEDTDSLCRYIVDSIGFILSPISVAILTLDTESSIYRTKCASGRYKESLMNLKFDREDSVIKQALITKDTSSPLSIGAEGYIPEGDAKTLYLFPVFYANIMEGLIVVLNEKLPPEDIKIINAFREQVESALRTHFLHLSMNRKMDEMLSTLLDSSISIAPLLNWERLLQTIVEKATQLLKAEQGSLMLFDQESSELRVKAKKSIDDIIEDNMRIQKGEGIAGKVFENGTPLLVEDVEKDPRINQKNKPRYKTKSFLSIPLKIEDRLVGVLNISDKISGEVFNENDLRLIQSFATNASIAIERNMLYKKNEELKELSVTDPLTGMLNRRYLNARLNEEIARFNRYKYPFSLLMVDIDEFKKYNDTFGHIAGDKVLRIVAHTIQQSLRSIDKAARFGGDEFVLILPQTPKADAINIANRIKENVEKIHFPEEEKIPPAELTVSIGLTAFPDDASSAAELLEKTDQALYLAKKGGKNRLVYL